MAHMDVVKGGTLPADVLMFARALVDAIKEACERHAVAISQLPSSAFGTEPRITRGSIGSGGVGVQQYAAAVDVSRGDTFGRHFLSSDRIRTTRMDMGYIVEQVGQSVLVGYSQPGQYLYNKQKAEPPSFPIEYKGRPDFRYAVPGGEAVLDITTPLEVGHLLKKLVTGSTTVETDPRVLYAVEIVWEDSDVREPVSGSSCLLL